jgi:serine/threonine protein kinase
MNIGVGSVLGGKWRLGPVLGEGSCGKVYKVTSTDNSRELDYEVVIKVIPTGKGLKGKAAKEQERLANTLNYEYMLHTGMLIGFPFAPRLPGKYYGLDADVRYLVMERLDMDLVEYARSSPSHSDIARIGQQLLSGLEWLHKKGYLFIDIKPQNFMLKGDKVYFVDCKFRALDLVLPF